MMATSSCLWRITTVVLPLMLHMLHWHRLCLLLKPLCCCWCHFMTAELYLILMCVLGQLYGEKKPKNLSWTELNMTAWLGGDSTTVCCIDNKTNWIIVKHKVLRPDNHFCLCDVSFFNCCWKAEFLLKTNLNKFAGPRKLLTPVALSFSLGGTQTHTEQVHLVIKILLLKAHWLNALISGKSQIFPAIVAFVLTSNITCCGQH